MTGIGTKQPTLRVSRRVRPGLKDFCGAFSAQSEK
jgi:hypothetical protein